ncbi:MAG: hypothetical protein HY744_02370 [Deltaproteobacteria bacterium]|nr:hypothetical protein [Deltaproteobacteria bacterium]
MNDLDCLMFVLCAQDCGQNQSCLNLCAADYPAGAALFNTYAECVVCKACYDDCDGKGSGCG